MPAVLDRIPARLAIGLAALFSGVALLATILLQVSLPFALLVAGTIVGVMAALALRRAEPDERVVFARSAAIGAAAGIVATIAYDAAKFALSQVDPSPYNPFEATRMFGILLLGEDTATAAIQAAGITFHLLNGTAFGVAFVILFGAEGRLTRRAALGRGIAWGLFLETFQLALYPGWLDIRAFNEFATISVLAHGVYGTVLGLVGRAMLRRWVFDPYRL